MRFSVALAALLSLGSLARADVVFLKGGQRLEGDIQEKGTGFEIKNEFGSWTFTKDEVVKIVPSVEKILAEGEDLHKKARALYNEALAIENDHKTANAKLRSGVDLLRKIVELYNLALETYSDPKTANLQKTVIALIQEMRLYRDKIHAEEVVATPKPEPPPPAPEAPAVRTVMKRLAVDTSVLLPKAAAGDVEAMAALGIHYDDQTWSSFEAQKWLRSAAEKGHARAQDRLGLSYALGKGVKQDFKEAVRWFTAAEKSGHPLARFHLGLLEWQGSAGPRSLEKAYAWCEKGVDGLWAMAHKGDPEALAALSWMLLEGIGRPQDLKKALDLCREAADAEWPPALNLLGLVSRDGRGGSEKDRSEAEKSFQKAAELGYAEAQVNLAELFDEYTGRKNDGAKDFKKAQLWYQKAADQGHGRAQYRLGLIHLDGKGVPKNPAEAMKLFPQALRNGTEDFLKALLNDLGYLYERGVGVKADPQESLKHYKMAADLGSAEAQYNLGSISLERKNDKDAYKWYVMSAKQGHALAQNNLGAFYASGRGVKKSLDEAEKWFLMAAQQGDASAVDNLKRLQKERGVRKP
jgi:TPR repeat protein